MAFIYTNPNPKDKLVGDCTVRALSIYFNKTWEDIFIDLSILAFEMGDMPSANEVWGEYLARKGLIRKYLPDECPLCYTINDFCNEYKKGKYIIGTGEHVVTVISGDYYDAWDSGHKNPIYYWTKGE